MKELINIFKTFFKIGLFTFGGGLAMLPLLKKELVENKSWITEDEIINFYSIGQCTPGIIAVNIATFVGFKLKGYVGAIFSTAGIVLPSFLIILVIASILKNILEIPFFIHVFAGIKIAVAALIFKTILELFKSNVKNKKSFALLFICFILNFILKIDPIYVIFLSIIVSICITKFKGGAKDDIH